MASFKELFYLYSFLLSETYYVLLLFLLSFSPELSVLGGRPFLSPFLYFLYFWWLLLIILMVSSITTPKQRSIAAIIIRNAIQERAYHARVLRDFTLITIIWSMNKKAANRHSIVGRILSWTLNGWFHIPLTAKSVVLKEVKDKTKMDCWGLTEIKTVKINRLHIDIG